MTLSTFVFGVLGAISGGRCTTVSNKIQKKKKKKTTTM
jgi:hypothetical protein